MQAHHVSKTKRMMNQVKVKMVPNSRKDHSKNKKSTRTREMKELVNNEDEETSPTDQIQDDEFQLHKQDLLALKDQDPEFYHYLQENDQELLNFSSDEDPTIEDAEMMMTPSTKDSPEEIIWTLETLQSWEQLVKKTHSLHTLKRLLMALRLACHSNEGEKEEKEPTHPYRFECSYDNTRSHWSRICLSSQTFRSASNHCVS
jgi:hypothetical protein